MNGKIVCGSFGELDLWLLEHIHRHGCRFDTKELVRRATGQEPNAKAFTAYLNRKFRALYRLS